MERVACEFFLIRYVPDVVKGEFVNIGVVLREAARPGANAPVQVRFTRDWRRVRCMDANADLELLEALEHGIAERLRTGVNPRDPKRILETLEDTLSNSVQISEAKATLAENLTTEMEMLMRMYVEPLKGITVPKGRNLSGRSALQAAMRTEFERAGVWGLMRKKIAAAPYTEGGDPLKIDCGYRQNGVIRMFHAVSLAGEIEAAKGLALSAQPLRDGVQRVEKATLDLAAVVEPLRTIAEGGDEAEERYRFGVKALEQNQIRVVTLGDLGRSAETARREMGLG